MITLCKSITWIDSVFEVLRNDISNILCYELWICMKVSIVMFKKEKGFQGNYI